MSAVLQGLAVSSRVNQPVIPLCRLATTSVETRLSNRKSVSVIATLRYFCRLECVNL